MTVYRTVVQFVYQPRIDYVQSALHVHGQHQMPCQSVARTAWYDAQCRLAVYQASRHLIDSAVATHCHYHIGSLVLILRSHLVGMSCILREIEFCVIALPVYMAFYQRGDSFLATRPRYRIYYKDYSLL